MSSQSTNNRVGLARSAVSWIRRHPEVVVALPGPEYEWAWRDLPVHDDTPTPFPDHILDYHATLHSKGIIKKVRHVTTPGNSRWVWTTDAEIYDYAQAVQEERGKTLPCGHRRGFKTQNATAGIYQCGHPDCEELYPRDVIEEVFG